MSIILSGLKHIGMVSGSYIGYNYGYVVKNKCCDTFPLIKKYDEIYCKINFKSSKLPEIMFYNSIGLFSGLVIGYHTYPLVIPIMIFQLCETFPHK